MGSLDFCRRQILKSKVDPRAGSLTLGQRRGDVVTTYSLSIYCCLCGHHLHIMRLTFTQLTRDIESMLGECWAGVVGDQH